MSSRVRALLVLVAVVSFAIALSYPITYVMERHRADEGMARLTALRDAGRQSAGRTAEPTDERATSQATGAPATGAPDAPHPVPANAGEATATLGPTTGADAPRAMGQATEAPATGVPDAPHPVPANAAAKPATLSPTTGVGAPRATSQATSAPATGAPDAPRPVPANDASATAAPGPTTGAGGTSRPAAERTPIPEATGGPTPAPTPTPSPTPVPTPTPDRRLRGSALSYPEKEKAALREEDILPEYRELYEINHDLVGWITIPRTPIDYPVLQSENREYYLKHDFFGDRNNNGQIILDSSCDPYTPSYNLVISGHNLYNDTMFSTLVKYRRRDYWEAHKIIRCDVLTQERAYVAFAAFFSADYDEDEEGFRYNTDIQYRVDAERWLAEIRENQIYDTGIDAAFGDEFLTLTTCNHTYRKNGRFVLVCRRLREGEVY